MTIYLNCNNSYASPVNGRCSIWNIIPCKNALILLLFPIDVHLRKHTTAELLNKQAR